MKLKKLKSSELDSAVFGMLLGDAGLSLAGKRAINYRFYYAHSNKQKEYALWKKDIIDQIGTVETRIYNYKHPVKKYEHIRITTNARKYFTKIARKFYKNNKKIVDIKILDKINPFGLAIWFMDDGSVQQRNTHFRAYLHTQSFSYEENKLIQKWFKNKFNIETKVGIEKKRNGNIYYLQVFNKRAALELIEIVKPFVELVPSMKYKLPK